MLYKPVIKIKKNKINKTVKLCINITIIIAISEKNVKNGGIAKFNVTLQNKISVIVGLEMREPF